MSNAKPSGKEIAYHTKRVILEIYGATADAERTGVPYQTPLDPPPADPPSCTRKCLDHRHA